MGSIRDNAKSGALTEVSFFILLSLYQPRHGYSIMQFIESKTSGRLILGAGSLYGALTNLQEKGYITPYEVDSSSRKKQYLITDSGKAIVETEKTRLEELIKTAREITED